MELPRLARNLPQPHYFIVPKQVPGKKEEKSVKATDLSLNERMLENLRTSIRLAKECKGDFACTLVEFLEHQGYLASCRCNYGAWSVLQHAIEMTKCAKPQKLSLVDSE